MPKEASRKEGSKRDKYTLQACFECQHRKVKCSGEPKCSSCKTRRIDCQYAGDSQHEMPIQKNRPSNDSTSEMSPKPQPRKRSKTSISLRAQLSQLQDQVKALSEQRSFSGTDIPAMVSYNMRTTDLDRSPKEISPSICDISENNAFDNHSIGSFAPSSQDIPSPLREPMEPDMLGATTPLAQQPTNRLPTQCPAKYAPK
ncbi:uncharacterized protein N7477_007219 [Penicillium maclennaniae]|uniref:uncharacterized protein n=1 Tax=Penicillium maclennaniae TaxID=1343394 RepID=UPI0025417E23|nr:uncharacterized protein N7477_007219 [Penicillium maclennaniae]KAJ5664771.1 hypothetical protein N7477_007219 [Penicillium maclennaniae]